MRLRPDFREELARHKGKQEEHDAVAHAENHDVSNDVRGCASSTPPPFFCRALLSLRQMCRLVLTHSQTQKKTFFLFFPFFCGPTRFGEKRLRRQIEGLSIEGLSIRFVQKT